MRAWDFLFLLLVIAPIVTGGLVVHKPGVHLEYTQPGAAALVLVLWLWWRVRQGKASLQSSWVYRTGTQLWNKWTKALVVRPLLPLSVAWVLVSLLWYLTSYFRHQAFGSGMADLGIFTNAIWNVSHVSHPFSSIKDGLSLLADHQNFLVYPFGWIFPLWPSPLFLLLLQAFGLSAGGIALYFLARQRLGKEHSLLPWLSIAYWMCGPLRAAARFDFHPEVMMLPLFLFAAWLLQERTWGRRFVGFLCLLAALAAKESAGPVACGLGLAWILGAGPVSTRSFTRILGGAVVVLGLGMFYFDSQVMPSWFGHVYSYENVYAPLRAAPLALLLAPFLQPDIFWLRIFSVSRMKFFLGCLLPFSFVPLLAPLALLAALPGFLMLFLTTGDHRISLGYHYAIEPLVGILFALPAALQSGFTKKYERHLLPALMLASLFSYGRSEVYFWRAYEATPHQAWVRNQVLPRVRPDVAVSASYGFVPHLATRHWVHEARMNGGQCYLWDRSVNNTPMAPYEMDVLEKHLMEQGRVLEFRCGSFSAYRNNEVDSCFSTLPKCEENL